MRHHHLPGLGLPCLIVAFLLSSGCTTTAAQEDSIRVAVSPSARSILNALFASAEVPLSVHPSCIGAGSDLEDATIGDYVSGFLAKLGDQGKEAHNFVLVDMPFDSPGDTWDVSVWMGQRPEEPERGWRREIRFSIRKSDNTIVSASYRCAGEGRPDP
jgi:hypothetical protein